MGNGSCWSRLFLAYGGVNMKLNTSLFYTTSNIFMLLFWKKITKFYTITMLLKNFTDLKLMWVAITQPLFKKICFYSLVVRMEYLRKLRKLSSSLFSKIFIQMKLTLAAFILTLSVKNVQWITYFNSALLAYFQCADPSLQLGPLRPHCI